VIGTEKSKMNTLQPEAASGIALNGNDILSVFSPCYKHK